MDPNPKSAKNKIAFTGTNSSGKTTMALKVTSRLKENCDYLAEVVSSQDRKITWKDDHFPVNPVAHYGMMCNMINAEAQAVLKGDADVVVTDRSILDLYAIAMTDHPHHPMIVNMWPMVLEYVKTYTKIYFLPPLAYQEDGKRPPNEFRMRTYATLQRILAENREVFHNVVYVERHEIWTDIKSLLGIEEKVDPLLYEEKLDYLAKVTGVTLFVKERETRSSDVDIWWEPTTQPFEAGVSKSTQDKLVRNFGLLFGESLSAHFMFLPPQCSRKLSAIHKVKIYNVLGEKNEN